MSETATDLKTYPTEGAAHMARTGKSVFQTVLEEAGAPSWVAGYAMYVLNTSPGYRPSDAARYAVRRWQNGYTEEQNAQRIADECSAIRRAEGRRS